MCDCSSFWKLLLDEIVVIRLCLFDLAAPGAWDFAIPHITATTWDAAAQMQQSGQDRNKADGNAAAAIATGGVQYQGQANTQLQQACRPSLFRLRTALNGHSILGCLLTLKSHWQLFFMWYVLHGNPCATLQCIDPM